MSFMGCLGEVSNFIGKSSVVIVLWRSADSCYGPDREGEPVGRVAAAEMLLLLGVGPAAELVATSACTAFMRSVRPPDSVPPDITRSAAL